jgi:hypothetical protein
MGTAAGRRSEVEILDQGGGDPRHLLSVRRTRDGNPRMVESLLGGMAGRSDLGDQFRHLPWPGSPPWPAMQQPEIAALRHDIERYISIANEHATGAEQLRAELRGKPDPRPVRRRSRCSAATAPASHALKSACSSARSSALRLVGMANPCHSSPEQTQPRTAGRAHSDILARGAPPRCSSCSPWCTTATPIAATGVHAAHRKFLVRPRLVSRPDL